MSQLHVSVLLCVVQETARSAPAREQEIIRLVRKGEGQGRVCEEGGEAGGVCEVVASYTCGGV